MKIQANLGREHENTGKPGKNLSPITYDAEINENRSDMMSDLREVLAGCKGLEPSTSDVTGRRSNQLS